MDLRAVGLELRLHLGEVSIQIFDDVLLDLAGDFAEPVGVRELVEQHFRPLLVCGFGALVDRRAFVGRKFGRENIERLDGHGNEPF